VCCVLPWGSDAERARSERLAAAIPHALCPPRMALSEAAALLAAQTDLSALVVEKHKLRGPDGKNATVSIARMAAAPSTPFSPPSVS